MNAEELRNLTNERGGQSLVDRILVEAKEAALDGQYGLLKRSDRIGVCEYEDKSPVVKLNDYGENTINRLEELGFKVEAVYITGPQSKDAGAYLSVGWRGSK